MSGQPALEVAPRYAKPLLDPDDEYALLDDFSGVDTPFELQVTLGDMDLKDAFRVALPSAYARLRFDRFLDQAFPEEPRCQAGVRTLVDLGENPDLPEMYNALLHIFKAWRSGRCALRFFLNHGPEVEMSDEVRNHVRVLRSQSLPATRTLVLDLVIEQRFIPMDYGVSKGYYDSKEQLLHWLKAHTLLYFVDRLDVKLEVEPQTERDRRLMPIVGYLSEIEVLAPSDETDSFEFTDVGRQRIVDMIAETERYVDLYGVFADTLHYDDSDGAEFGTGWGDDLRVQVYEAEGLDPLRVVFLLALYDSSIDDLAGDWRESIHDEEFFEEVLMPVADRPEVDPDLLDGIIESGFAYVEERAEEVASETRRRQILNRVRGRKARQG